MKRARTDVYSRTIVALLLVGALCTAEGVLAGPLDWALYDARCTEIESDLVVPCGDYGIFHFGNVVLPPQLPIDCLSPIADRTGENIQSYPRPLGNPAFPLEPPQVPDPQNPLVQYPPPEDGEEEKPQIAALDWMDEHGATVASLAWTMSIAQADAFVYDLEDPDLSNALGSAVSDAHVLVKMCEVYDHHANGRFDIAAVNLSFGRVAVESDPPPTGVCNEMSLSCQIGMVAGQLRTDGVPTIAAAGNHRELLFPARLPDVLAAGTLDVTHYIGTFDSIPTWESPDRDRLDALPPGHALCANFLVAPAGSSFSAAVFSGWLTQALLENPGLDPYGSGVWEILWSVDQGCFTLSRDRVEYTSCNVGLLLVVDGILHGPASGCWEDPVASGKQIVYTSTTGPVRENPPPYDSLVEWVASHLPAPEDDPCIPCIGGFSQSPLHGPESGLLESGQPESELTDLLVNFSSTAPTRGTNDIDSIYLRLDGAFHRLDLTQDELDTIRDGEIGGVQIAGLGPLSLSEQASIITVFNSQPQTGPCHPGGDLDCWWTSTPLLIP